MCSRQASRPQQSSEKQGDASPQQSHPHDVAGILIHTSQKPPNWSSKPHTAACRLVLHTPANMSPYSPSGMPASICASYFSGIAAVMSLAMKPGATALQVMLRPAYSRATVLVKPITPGEGAAAGAADMALMTWDCELCLWHSINILDDKRAPQPSSRSALVSQSACSACCGSAVLRGARTSCQSHHTDCKPAHTDTVPNQLLNLGAYLCLHNLCRNPHGSAEALTPRIAKPPAFSPMKLLAQATPVAEAPPSAIAHSHLLWLRCSWPVLHCPPVPPHW